MRHTRLLAVPAAAALLTTFAVPLAVAQSDESELVHRESVLTDLSATGETDASRVFTQLGIPGGGDGVELSGQATSGLRTLSGPKPTVDGDTLRFPGAEAASARTVADHTAELPVSIEVVHTLDGETIEPEELVGRSGEVAVTYRVQNLTATATELTVVDGQGNETVEEVDVAIPLVGSLALTLPDSFSEVTAPGGVVVGDGRGGTVVNWSLLLFAPLGAEQQEVTWTARTTKGMVPAASLQVLPVTPDSFGSLASTEAAYAGAVDSTTELATGAFKIDENLQSIAEGAGELFTGLEQLRNGATSLAEGLTMASGGAGDLAEGTGEARSGATELSSGLGDLSGGATRLSAGLGDARDGGEDLSDGLGQLGDGASALAGGAGQVLTGLQLLSSQVTGDDGLPRAIAGISQLVAGIGTIGQEGTLLDGMNQLEGGLAQAQAGLDGPLRGGVDAVDTGLGDLAAGLGDAHAGVGALQTGAGDLVAAAGALDAALATASGLLATLQTTTLDATQQELLGGALTYLDGMDLGLDKATVGAATLEGGLGQLRSSIGDPSSPAGATLLGGVAQLRGGMAQIDGGLAELSAAIGSPAATQTLRNGVARLTAGVSNPGALAGNPTCDPTLTNPADRCGLLEGLQVLQGGLRLALDGVAGGLGSTTTENTLLYGANQVAGGASQLEDGAEQAATGGQALVSGLGQLDAGSTELAAGAGRAEAGGQQLAGGLVRLDDGAGALAGGLVDARDGSEQLAEGLTSATSGSSRLGTGAALLQGQGTALLADEVSEATASSSLQLEQVQAVAARGVAGDGLPYPTADGAVASAVYQFDLAGVGVEEGPATGGRLLIGLLGLAGAAMLWLAFRRRLVEA